MYDQIMKKMALVIVKRFEFIPTKPDSDWRDLPNTVGKLRDGNMSKNLLYFYSSSRGYISMTGEETAFF